MSFRIKRVQIGRLCIAALCYMTLVCLHELGHWCAAQCLGFHAPVFKIGHGEPHFALFKLLGTEFRLNPWPIGGAVQINELLFNDSAGAQSLSRSLQIKRILVLVAGAAVNFLCAFALGRIITRSKQRTAGSLILIANQSVETGKALIAIFLLRTQRCSNPQFQYLSFVQIPFYAAESNTALLCVLFSTALSQGIFNLLPLPFLDGGKIALALLSFSGSPLDYQLVALTNVLSALALFIMFAGAVYRGLRWPIPRRQR